MSNSAGNLVLHLCGNIKQWIIAGLGGELDIRERDKEFSERGPIRRRVLVVRLSNTVKQACRVMDGLDAETLLRRYTIQGYRTTGLGAVADLRFTHLPALKARKQPRIKRGG